jgi:hypothetical protein
MNYDVTGHLFEITIDQLHKHIRNDDDIELFISFLAENISFFIDFN